MKGAFKVVLGILLIPVFLSVIRAFSREIAALRTFSISEAYFFYGVIGYFIMHTVIWKPDILYVFEHEVGHVIASLLSFSKVTSFKVGKKSGSVSTEKSNFFISTFPYYFPFYAIMVILAYRLLELFGMRGIEGWLGTALFLIGFTLTLHIIMTLDAMKVQQPDFMKAGLFLAIIAVCILNCVTTMGILCLVLGGVSFNDFIVSAYFGSVDIYKHIFTQLFVVR